MNFDWTVLLVVDSVLLVVATAVVIIAFIRELRR
jgi:hypothetical protein